MSTTSEKRLSARIAPAFFAVHRDIRRAGHTHYWLRGGRGSGKSSFVSVEIMLGLTRHPDANAAVFRKVKDTLRDSVFSQIIWAADLLGVGSLWKATGSPMRLTHTRTGQEIVFRGLDDANKSKSLKPQKGVFRYLWFEELAEFSGMEEIRKVCQSVLRGGGRFCCFYTYNPPKSQRSWVNAEASAPAAGRLVHSSDYLAMPCGWLGEPFLAEAEHLREARPDIYAHEYLGDVTGTGTEVFTNLTFREITDAEILRFGELSRGLDFGYASDPLHYTVCHYDSTRRRLYVFFELRALRMSNAALAGRILAEMRVHGRGNVCCDSEDPKSIDDLYMLGVPAYPAKKGPGSVGWGLRFLSEEVEEIIIDPTRCPETKREFYHYALDVDGAGSALPVYPDRDNHSIDAVRYALERRVRARFAGRAAKGAG